MKDKSIFQFSILSSVEMLILRYKYFYRFCRHNWRKIYATLQIIISCCWCLSTQEFKKKCNYTNIILTAPLLSNDAVSNLFYFLIQFRRQFFFFVQSIFQNKQIFNHKLWKINQGLTTHHFIQTIHFTISIQIFHVFFSIILTLFVSYNTNLIFKLFSIHKISNNFSTRYGYSFIFMEELKNKNCFLCNQNFTQHITLCFVRPVSVNTEY